MKSMVNLVMTLIEADFSKIRWGYATMDTRPDLDTLYDGAGVLLKASIFSSVAPSRGMAGLLLHNRRF